MPLGFFFLFYPYGKMLIFSGSFVELKRDIHRRAENTLALQQHIIGWKKKVFCCNNWCKQITVQQMKSVQCLILTRCARSLFDAAEITSQERFSLQPAERLISPPYPRTPSPGVPGEFPERTRGISNVGGSLLGQTRQICTDLMFGELTWFPAPMTNTPPRMKPSPFMLPW